MDRCHRCGGTIGVGQTIHFIAPHLWLPHAEVQEMIDTNAPLPFLCHGCAIEITRGARR